MIWVLENEPRWAAEALPDSLLVPQVQAVLSILNTTYTLITGRRLSDEVVLCSPRHPWRLWTQESFRNWWWLERYGYYCGLAHAERYKHFCSVWPNIRCFPVLPSDTWHLPKFKGEGDRVWNTPMAFPRVYPPTNGQRNHFNWVEARGVARNDIQFYRDCFKDWSQPTWRWSKPSYQPLWFEWPTRLDIARKES